MILPLLLVTSALAVILPAALRRMLPEPFADTTLFVAGVALSAPLLSTVKSLASTSMLMCPLPARVRTPVPPMIKPSVSCIKMFPLVLFVATRVPMAVSISAAPDAPIPVAATKVAVPLVVIFGASEGDVMSVIAPAVAVTFTALLVVVTCPSFTFVAARRST